jgi:hypothetical protein
VARQGADRRGVRARAGGDRPWLRRPAFLSVAPSCDWGRTPASSCSTRTSPARPTRRASPTASRTASSRSASPRGTWSGWRRAWRSPGRSPSPRASPASSPAASSRSASPSRTTAPT